MKMMLSNAQKLKNTNSMCSILPVLVEPFYFSKPVLSGLETNVKVAVEIASVPDLCILFTNYIFSKVSEIECFVFSSMLSMLHACTA